MKVAAKRTCVVLLVLIAASHALLAQDTADNPFAGFETHILPNGLKVWFKRMPGQGNAALSVTVRVGWDSDPLGKEEMAHYLEHMQFGDHVGLSTQEIKKQIEDRGGVWNGSTGPDRTFYYVRIKKDNALFALDWLYRVISPHEMKPDVVERERYPVEVEVGAKPREIMDWVYALYLNPPYLRQPGVWKREFGIQTTENRDDYTYRSLRSITPQDLRQFYDRHYSPTRMTLTVIGDLDRDAVLGLVNGTFATLRQAQEPPAAPTATDAGRSRSTFFWDARSNISYTRRIRFASMTARDEVMLTFIGRFLGKRLNDRLRFGEQKAVYGVFTGLVTYGPAGYFQIGGSIRETEFESARRVIGEEIEALRRGTHADAIFEAEKSVLVQQLRVSNSTPEALERWAGFTFDNRDRHRDFPDVISAFQAFSKAEVAAFVSEHFVPRREFNTTIYPIPVSQLTLGVFGVALLFGTVRLMRWMLARPVDMKRIRYVAHFRIPKLLYLTAGAVLVIAVAVGVRLLIFVYEVFSNAFLYPRDSVLIQWPVFALMGISVVMVLILALSLVPSKVLVFDDRLLIKYVAFRSVPVRFDDIADLSLHRFAGIWWSRRLWKCVPFKWGLVSPGIYLKRRDGWSYFFDVKNRSELVELLSDQRPRNNVARA